MRSGLLDLQIGSDAACIPILDQFQRLLVLGDRRIEKLLLGIKRAGLEVVQSQLRVHRQVHCCQVGCAGLRLLAIRFNGAAHASPDVELIRQLQRNLKVVVRNSIGDDTRRPMVRDSVARCTRARGNRGKVTSPLIANKCTSLCVSSFSRLQVLVGDIDLSFEGIELRILKDFPPVGAEALIIRLGRFPNAHLLISWRDFRCRAPIFRSNRASGQLERSYSEQNQKTGCLARARDPDQLSSAFHLISPGNVA